MEFSNETHGTSTYLVYTVPQDEQLDMVSVGMLVNNRIPGLAQTVFTQMDRTRYIKYNISTRIPADQLFMGPVSRQRFLGVIIGITTAMLSVEEYMLDPNSILLELGRMYLDVQTGETILICVPSGEQRDQLVNLKDFIKKIMYDTSFDQSEDCGYVTKIINYLNSSAVLVLSDFQEFLRSLAAERAQSQQSRPKPSIQAAPESGIPIRTVKKPTQSLESPPRQLPVSQPLPKTAEQKIEVPPSPPRPESATVEETEAEDKPISLMHLLRHYSKENAEAYKAQKGKKEKKEKKGPAASKRSKKGKGKPAPEGFMIPGAENSGHEAGELPVEVPQRQPEPQPVPVGAATQPASESFTPPPAFSLKPQPGPGAVLQAQSFGETDYFPDSEVQDETVILGVEQAAQRVAVPFLIRRKNNERIPVDKPIFRLGRDVDFNDYAILDNRHVGHSHCHLIQQDGEYFIQDDNSRNHTKVNGTVIPPGQPVKIAHGYTISVADEEFEFKLY